MELATLHIGLEESVAERRLRTLAELATHAVSAKRPEEACSLAIQTLERHSGELAFASIYLAEVGGEFRRAAASASAPADAGWPLSQSASTREPISVEPAPALLVPLRPGADSEALGVLAAGLRHGVVLDGKLLEFLTQVGQLIGVTLAVTAIYAQGERHVQIVALQDHALQTFFVIGLLARAALAELAPEQVSENVATALVQIIDVATTGREDLRQAIFALGHTEVGQSGIVQALQTLAHNFEKRTGIEAEVLVTGSPRNLPTEAAEALHHAAAEALANIERHSQAGAVVLSLQITRRNVTLSVQDDGVGIANPALERIASSASHFGLRGIGLRVRELGGTFVAKPSRDGGFVVRTRLPLTP